jgi:hypothetical protein
MAAALRLAIVLLFPLAAGGDANGFSAIHADVPCPTAARAGASATRLAAGRLPRRRMRLLDRGFVKSFDSGTNRDLHMIRSFGQFPVITVRTRLPEAIRQTILHPTWSRIRRADGPQAGRAGTIHRTGDQMRERSRDSRQFKIDPRRSWPFRQERDAGAGGRDLAPARLMPIRARQPAPHGDRIGAFIPLRRGLHSVRPSVCNGAANQAQQGFGLPVRPGKGRKPC